MTFSEAIAPTERGQIDPYARHRATGYLAHSDGNARAASSMTARSCVVRQDQRMSNAEPSRWQFGGRWYATTLASDVLMRDGIGLELDDVGPAPGRGQVLEAFQDDTTGQVTFTAHVTEPLPFDLVEQFVLEARSRLIIASV